MNKCLKFKVPKVLKVTGVLKTLGTLVTSNFRHYDSMTQRPKDTRLKNKMSKLKKHLILSWIFILIIPTTSFGQVVLNEIMFDPLFSDRTDEFIEIINVSDTASFDLAGWTIQDQDGSDDIISSGHGTMLKPGQYGLILDPDYFAESRTYDNLIPEYTLIITINGATLGSRGLSNSTPETIILTDQEGNSISSYTYSIDNEPGYSEEKIDPTKPDSPDNWENSITVHGTPGFRNSVFSAHIPEAVSITVDPNPFSPDQDGIDDTACITYSLPWTRSTVTVKIFDVSGRLIKTLLSVSPSGAHNTIYWDGTTLNNTTASVGMYIIFLEALCEREGETLSHKKTIVLARSL